MRRLLDSPSVLIVIRNPPNTFSSVDSHCGSLSTLCQPRAHFSRRARSAKLKFSGFTRPDAVLRDEAFEIRHVETDSATHFYKGNSSLPDPAVESGWRNCKELGRFIYIHELGWPSGINRKFHRETPLGKYLVSGVHLCVPYANFVFAWRLALLAVAG